MTAGENKLCLASHETGTEQNDETDIDNIMPVGNLSNLIR